MGTEASVSRGPRFSACDKLSYQIGWVGRHLETKKADPAACCGYDGGALNTVALLESNRVGKTYLEKLGGQVEHQR